ncbi:tachykinin-like peptides receptor 99D isoform X2 [Euwallacea similis]|uniref:tachykinin-like peptides receptor 99D isoform X2 n=1 Tax=Euwallacea similis TaxID=1736056 RepID=UPI00344FAE02
MVDYSVYHENTSIPNFSEDNYSSQYPYVNDTFEDRNQFILPVWRQVLWSILYAGMVIVATGGNLIVIWIVLAHKRMRTVTNYFLLNLSIADTMVSTLNVTFNYVYMLYSHWPFGELYCKISQFIAVLSVCASVFSLMSISIDRYMAIMTPLKPRMGRIVTLALVVITWVLGIIIGLPSLLYYKTYRDTYSNGEERVICYPEWPDTRNSNESLYEYYFNVIFLVITYLVPILSMTYTYARIGIELWGSQSIGECTQRQMDNIKSKRRVVKMMMVVVMIFAVCWLPYQLYFIIISYYPKITRSEYIQETFLAIYWLAMSNSMYNPIIYCWMNARFRRGFKQFFSCLPFVQVSPGALTRREVLTSKRRSYSGSPEHNRIIRNGTLRMSCNPYTSIAGGRPSPSSSTNTCYSHVPDELVLRRCEMRQLS